MLLTCLKSLNKIQTTNKNIDGHKSNKFKMFYTEVYDVGPSQRKKHSSDPHSGFDKTGLLSTDLLNLLGDEVVKNHKPNRPTQKIKPQELNPHKHKTHGSRHRSREVSSEHKNENKDKVCSTSKREIPIKNKDFIVKQIPLKKNLLEFSIDRSQCPMVVRIHKGNPKTSENKQGPETSDSQPLSHSLSCPPCIDDQFKTTSDNKSSKYKVKRQKLKYRPSHGCSISELFNLSPRNFNFTRVATKKSRSDVFTNLDKSGRLRTKKMLESKSKLQNSSMSKGCKCNAEKIKDRNIKEKQSSDKKSVRPKPHKISIKEKCRKSAEVELANEYKTDMSDARENTCDKECINEHWEDKETPVKQTGMCENQNYAEGVMSHRRSRHTDCGCQKCKPLKRYKMKQAHLDSSDLNSLELHNSMHDPQKCFEFENVPIEKVIEPENVVTLDASRSQFYKISAFLKNNISKFNQNMSSEMLNLSLKAQNDRLVFGDHKWTENTMSKINLNPSTCVNTRKVRSEEKCLDEYIDINGVNKLCNNKQSGSFPNPQRYSSSVTSLNRRCCATGCNLGYTKLKVNNSQSSSCYKCRGCNKSIGKTANLDPYCSDCNLKAKLSQISNETNSTNPDFNLKEGLAPSVKALTIIPESDLSFPKQLVSVAIQTDCASVKGAQENKTTIKPNINANTNQYCQHSLENIIKEYCRAGMVSEFVKLQKHPSNNIDLFYDELFGGDFERKIKRLEPGGDLASSPEDPFRRSALNLAEPNLYNYRARVNKNDLQKELFTHNKNGLPEHQIKTSVSFFVSPIFPEKEYYRITCNKHGNTSSNRTVKSKTALGIVTGIKCSQNYTHKPSEINFQTKFNWDPSECFSTHSGTLSQRKETKYIEGSYISYEKRITFDREIKNRKTYTHSLNEKSPEQHNVLSFYKRGNSFPGHMNILPGLSLSVTNIKDSFLSLDNGSKIKTNNRYKENFKINTRHTLPRATKHQTLNSLSPHQSLNFQNSTTDLTACRMVCDITPRQKELALIMKQERSTCIEETNCLEKEICCNNTLFCKPSNFSNMELYAPYKRVKHPMPTFEVEKGIITDHEVARNQIILFKDSKKDMENPDITQHFERTPETTDVFELHSFSYILFNISMPGRENDTSEIEKKETKQRLVPSQTGLVLVPKNAEDNLNDIIIGSKFKTQINKNLMLRKETSSHEFNVFELSALSGLPKVGAGERSDLQQYNAEKDNPENKPRMYKVFSSSNEVKESNNVTDIERKTNDLVSNEKILVSPTEPSVEIIENHGKINNDALNKKKSKSPRGRLINVEKLKEGKKKSNKINHFFMCSYMTHLSFYRFVGDLQTRVCSELRKSKFV